MEGVVYVIMFHKEQENILKSEMATMHFVVVQWMAPSILRSDVLLGVIKRKMLVEVGVLLYIVH
jgi:hypothetical protein